MNTKLDSDGLLKEGVLVQELSSWPEFHQEVMTLGPTGLEVRQIPVQVAEDHGQFLRVAQATLRELLPSRDR